MSTEDNKDQKDPDMNNEQPRTIKTENQTDDENIVNLDGMNGEPSLEMSADMMVESLQKDLLEARERTMRALADAENTRKRAMKDREDAGKYAVSNFARDLLDFGDNFKRALESMPDDMPESVTGGLEAMERELLATFDRHGIKKIEPLDEMFDANFHEVMFEMPADKPAGTIMQIIEAGYVLNGRLLRAAKVGIAKAAPAEDGPTDPGASIDTKA